MARLKVILSHGAALKKKYGYPFPELEEALGALIAADAMEGVETRILHLDDDVAMRAVGAEPVADPEREKQNKVAVDGVCRSLRPDYILLLGASDVIPHQRLENPFEAPSDPDYGVPSDLPYGCDAPYSRNIAHFLAPTRMIGRLPDIRGKTGDREYLLDVLRNAAVHRTPRPETLFLDCFAFCRDDAADYTRMIMQAVFGSGDALQVVNRDASPRWSSEQLAKFVHYGNCHGMPFRPMFFGTGTDNVMLDLEMLEAHRLSPGMAAAFEACYGAQLYDPRNPRVPGDGMGICNTYLQKGCVAYFGSSNTSFGSRKQSAGTPVSPAGLCNADLITQHFLKHLVSGCSSGQACLDARHDFVEEMIRRGTGMTPTALKTLAQFNLMGDPSITLVERPRIVKRGLVTPPDTAKTGARSILETCRVSRHVPQLVLSASVRSFLETQWKDHVKEDVRIEPMIRSFQLSGPEGVREFAGPQRPTHVHTVSLNLTRQRDKGSLPRIVVFELIETDGEIQDVSQYESK